MARLGRSKPASTYGRVVPFSIINSIPSTLYYALYDTTTGELLSFGPGDPPIPDPGTDVYVTADFGLYQDFMVWDVVSRSFVLKVLPVVIDRVSDLVADPSLAAVWAALSADQSQALQTRIRQMLGPFRWRFDFQDIDLQLGWGTT
jgi:hypothetical protein